MRIEAIVDFYILESLVYQCNYIHVPYDNGESYNVKREAIRTRINREYNRLSHELADCFRDYMWMASFGESRHAWGKVNGNSVISIDIPHSTDDGREGSMREALNYNPSNPDNVKRLLAVFNDCHWNTSSFGGRNWGKIVDSINFYNRVPCTVYVDYCMDLQHNSGTVFSKSQCYKFIDFDLNGSFYCDMREFLDCKRDSKCIAEDLPIAYAGYVSRTVKNLVREWYDITPSWVCMGYAKVDYHTYKQTQWGNKVLSEKTTTPNIEREKYHTSSVTPVLSSSHSSHSSPVKKVVRIRRDQLFCGNCEEVVDTNTEDVYYIKRLDCHVCYDCYHRIVKHCEACNRRLIRNGKHSFDIVRGRYYCSECYCETFTTCYHCEETILMKDAWYSELSQNEYCESCYDELFTKCSHCDREVYNSDTRDVEDDQYCRKCYHEIFPECPSCREHDTEHDFIVCWCNICQQLEHWCNDCLSDGDGYWVAANGHELARELPAKFTVTPLQITFEQWLHV